ncbi:hypothetical protein [Mesorhizobium prunaredense]|uniref:hypothetical protein n=1 Tax=Mesorhizobium prunaredense TaxID=1631249 RepID=UPI00142DEE6C|nr:hypothetical protein [Mesorhizobium prunaredense]
MLFSRRVQSADLGQPAEPACNLALACQRLYLTAMKSIGLMAGAGRQVGASIIVI